jgi:hypothetical protein
VAALPPHRWLICDVPHQPFTTPIRHMAQVERGDRAIRGVRCPQDIALVSFDDLECFEFMNPRVSGVAQPTYDLGAYAATLLLKRIGGDSQSPPRRKILKTKLINETKNDASQSTLPLDPDLAEILLTRRATSP